jgi:hypothetical protein
MRFTYDFEDGRNPNMIDVDEDVENPSQLWENDCGATQKTCGGMQYFGGKNECGEGHTIHRTI